MPDVIDFEARMPVYAQLAAILRGQIRSGQIQPGRAIPSKKRLMQEYGVGATSVDRAVNVLREEGLVETELGRGIFVVDALPPEAPGR